MKIKYRVDLTEEERGRLLGLISKGRHGARTLARARILLKADEGELTDEGIAAALNVGYATVGRVRQRFVEDGLERALQEAPRPGAKPKLDERQCAHVIAVACSEAPEGHDHWTLRLLADKVVELGFAESYSHEAVRQTLKKTTSSHGNEKCGASPRSVPSM
jgi:transposase